MNRRAGEVVEEQVEHLDIYDAELADEYYAVTHEARRRCPVGHTDRNGGHFFVTSFDLAKAVLGDSDTFSSECGALPGRPWPEELPRSVVSTDPPLHRDFRQLLDPLFTRTALEPQVPVIHDIARTLVGEFVDSGRAEIMAQYAQPLTAAVLAGVVFGLDWQTYRDELQRIAHLVEQGISATNPDPDEARRELNTMATRIVRERQASGVDRHDVLGALLGGEVGGEPLTEAQVVGNLGLVIAAGLDTTKSAIGSIVWRMTEDPTLESRLRGTEWARSDLDEFLRIDTPVTGLCRTARRDTLLSGCPVGEGAKVHVMYAAANRDGEVFDNPDDLDFDRLRNPHLAFGGGIHRCLGSNLARMQIEIAIDELLARVREIRVEPGAELHWYPGTIRHLVELPIVFARVEAVDAHSLAPR